MNKKAVTPYELAQIIGAETVDRLNETFAGRRYNFTKKARTSDFESLEARNQHIRRLSLCGYPHNKLAEEFSLSEKRIRDIVNYRADEEIES